VIRRGLRGATRRPPHERPANGFGRLARPGPQRTFAAPLATIDDVVAALVGDRVPGRPEAGGKT
jgi:hypothetical protein